MAKKLYSDNCTTTIINPERIPQAQENVAKAFVQIVENRINKMRQEALKETEPTTPSAG